MNSKEIKVLLRDFRKVSKRLSALNVLALCVAIVVAAGCGDTDVSVTGGGATSSSSSETGGATNSSSSESAPASSSGDSAGTMSSSQASGSAEVPAGYVLDSQCSTGTGDTGVTIYYLTPPSDSYRYAC